MRRVDAAERRARLGRRCALAAENRAPDVVEAARRVVCLHGTDPATVFLSAWARVDAAGVADVERALYTDRSLIKHLAMRRTLFVVPRDQLAVVQAAASARVAATERRRLIRVVEAAGLYEDGERWLTDVSAQVLEVLAETGQATMAELRRVIPAMAGSLTYGEGRTWGGSVAVGPQVLTTLSAAGRIVRASNVGGWTSSRPRWATMRSWLGTDLPEVAEAESRAALVRAWLQRFGPGTEADITWWLGCPVTATRKALTAVAAVPVDLGGATGYVLPDDEQVEPPVEPWAALLPALDPTTMGWSQREFYLGPYKQALFDRNGNAGPTAWWNGRIVGGWHQDGAANVVVDLLEAVGPDGRRALQAEAERLTAWLGGIKVQPRFPTAVTWDPAGRANVADPAR